MKQNDINQIMTKSISNNLAQNCATVLSLAADEKLGDPPPHAQPGVFSGQRQGWKISNTSSRWLHCGGTAVLEGLLG